MDIEFKKLLKNQLSKISSAEDVFELFKTLNYPKEKMFDVSYERQISDFSFRKEDSERINKIYPILNFDENLPVFLLETISLAPSFIRSVATKFDSQYMRFLIILVDEDYSEMIFVLPDREKLEKGKYRLKITKLVVNKEDVMERNEYYTVIDTLSKIMYENESSWRDIWIKWKESFNVEKVTEAFFEDYKNIFFKLRNSIQTSLVSPKGAHEYTLQFLNRIMFIYFISKKGWLKYPKFMFWFWKSYKKQNKFGSNEFHLKWLNPVFFKGFNNRSFEVKDLPQEIKDVISSFPYLNGGLFKENNIDSCPVKIKDEMFQKIFEFFEKYNFTIKEDMPFELEVAVDPQMIGYIYETLASLSSKDVDIYTESEKKEDAESRKKWGIFYTPIIEVDFMCRRSLVEYLFNHLSDLPKNYIYHFVFDAPSEIDETEKYITQKKLWDRLEYTLDNLSVVDPACGSGAFLVGMMNLLGELYGKVYKHTNTNLDDYQMKYRIIQRSLYGVDVMKWAVNAAELRLWLQLIIETNITGEELRKSPLLPNLNLNLRVGDSLIQEIGGMSFNVRSNDIDHGLKKKLEELKHEKAQYFENPQRSKYKSIEAFHKQELKLFNSIIDSRIKIIQDEIELKENRSKSKQVTLEAKTPTKAKKFDDKLNKIILEEIRDNKSQIQNLKKMRKALKGSEKKPFVWEIDFAEIFGEKNGFDVVIGNPPYINYKKISPPNLAKNNLYTNSVQKYKSNLKESILTNFPSIKKISGMSDYFIYFYFQGLSLLNEKGSFCFITSNFWLDVDYGANLQEFLLKYVPIHAIYDNSAKKSFLHANINTVITLFGSPKFSNEFLDAEKWPIRKNIAKFIMFKCPFEQVINSENLIEIENLNKLIDEGKGANFIKNDYKVFYNTQENLLEDGWDYPDNYDYKKGKFASGSYLGDKWGGKYLRAPEIFFKLILNPKIIKLGSISKIKTGLKESGYSEYIKSVKDAGLIENKIKILKNVKLHEKIEIQTNDSFIVNKIDHFKNSVKDKKSSILWMSMRGEKHICFYNPNKIPFTGNFFGIEPINAEEIIPLVLTLNSTLIFLIFEILARKGFGGGSAIMVKSDLKNHMLINILDNFELKKASRLLNQISRRKIESIFIECGLNPGKPIREQEPNPLPDRAELDGMIFDELGLNEEDRKEVYWGVCELVKQRIKKAKSLKGG